MAATDIRLRGRRIHPSGRATAARIGRRLLRRLRLHWSAAILLDGPHCRAAPNAELERARPATPFANTPALEKRQPTRSPGTADRGEIRSSNPFEDPDRRSFTVVAHLFTARIYVQDAMTTADGGSSTFEDRFHSAGEPGPLLQASSCGESLVAIARSPGARDGLRVHADELALRRWLAAGNSGGYRPNIHGEREIATRSQGGTVADNPPRNA